MTSLLERMSLPGTTVGPVRSNSKSNRAGGSSPYNRNSRPPKGDVNGTWKHDMYGAQNSLSARITDKPAVPKLNMSQAERALREANGEKGLSIKGASSRGNVVQVGELAAGTTAEDVKAIFQRCGPITDSKVTQNGDPVVVRVTFKNEKDAQAAVAKFHGQPADGRFLAVKIIGGVNANLIGRLGVSTQDDSVDALMADDSSSKAGSKLRSDELLAKGSRATILVAPPGTDPTETRQGSTR
ncbi:unnamed protein product [Somion occarium]|uniref:RRM domain-containing protein n=1 Tax=Somion occarium TaxID=3059160 RepID=A0ABP1DWB1_9APHY